MGRNLLCVMDEVEGGKEYLKNILLLNEIWKKASGLDAKTLLLVVNRIRAVP